MLVERSVYDKACGACKSSGKHQGRRSGTEGDHIGPLSSSIQFEKVQALIPEGH
ncbi:hypothetical protein VXQ18_15635 [Brucella abortus]|nr:hypothetical protein [Brucella abortus]